MYAQQPYPLQGQKQGEFERLPIYTRRGLATFIHVLVAMACAVLAVLGWFYRGLAVAMKNNPNFKQQLKDVEILPAYVFYFYLFELLVTAVTSIIAVATPKFLHREQGAVLLSLLPMILARVACAALNCYYGNFIDIYGLPIFAVVVYGMLQGPKDNCLASWFVPFRKQ